MFALAATSSCSACSTSGRRSSNCAGRPLGTWGGTSFVGDRLPAGDRRRRPAEQHAQRVLGDGDLALDVGDRRGRDGAVGLGLVHFQAVRDAALEPRRVEGDGLVVQLDGPPGDLEREVEFAQVEVGRRDVAHEGDHQRLPALLRRQVLGDGGFPPAAQPAEEIDLPRERAGERPVAVGAVGNLLLGQLRVTDARRAVPATCRSRRQSPDRETTSRCPPARGPPPRAPRRSAGRGCSRRRRGSAPGGPGPGTAATSSGRRPTPASERARQARGAGPAAPASGARSSGPTVQPAAIRARAATAAGSGSARKKWWVFISGLPLPPRRRPAGRSRAPAPVWIRSACRPGRRASGSTGRRGWWR